MSFLEYLKNKSGVNYVKVKQPDGRYTYYRIDSDNAVKTPVERKTMDAIEKSKIFIDDLQMFIRFSECVDYIQDIQIIPKTLYSCIQLKFEKLGDSLDAVIQYEFVDDANDFRKGITFVKTDSENNTNIIGQYDDAIYSKYVKIVRDFIKEETELELSDKVAENIKRLNECSRRKRKHTNLMYYEY